jgi:hypothetical protein
MPKEQQVGLTGRARERLVRIVALPGFGASPGREEG